MNQQADSWGFDMVFTTLAIRYEHDVVLTRQRARQIAALLGFESHDQVRIATAVSEIARNAFRYARDGKAQFGIVSRQSPALRVVITDQGKGIASLDNVLNGTYVSSTGMGMGLLGARRLMDGFDIQSGPGGTRVLLDKKIPRRSYASLNEVAANVARELAVQAPQDPFEELQQQNQEMLGTLQELQRRQNELAQLNKELQDTNRGVVALYSELDERADYLRRASELKTQFLSNMTHEFRTPLNSMLSLSRMLLDRLDGDLTTEQEKQVRFIQKAAEDLSELVNDLLDLAKVEAGKVKVNAAEFSVDDLFGALRGMLRPLLMHTTEVSLIFDDASDVSIVCTDESKVSQVLRNLISNALKFTSKGEVRVSAGMEDAETVCFKVQDTGVGIAEENLETIFEEFVQVEGPHQRGKHGTGLGLPLSRRLAELLGGTLTVQSTFGVGSCFTLRLPLRYKGGGVAAVFAESGAVLDPLRIPVLVVEDNRETLFFYEKYFKGNGYQALPARTLKQARTVLDELRPAAIILDIMLSHESTWAFLGELKQHPQMKDIPVLVITMVENEQNALHLGAEAFHSKPVDPGWLLRELDRHTETYRQDALVVDDDAASRYVLKGFLADTLFRLREAGGGTQGLNMALEKTPALIFLDLVMPDANGLEVLEQLRKDGRTAEVPVLVYTSKRLQAREKRQLDKMRAVVLPKKDVDKDQFASELRAALSSARLKVRKMAI